MVFALPPISRVCIYVVAMVIKCANCSRCNLCVEWISCEIATRSLMPISRPVGSDIVVVRLAASRLSRGSLFLGCWRAYGSSLRSLTLATGQKWDHNLPNRGALRRFSICPHRRWLSFVFEYLCDLRKKKIRRLRVPALAPYWEKSLFIYGANVLLIFVCEIIKL